MNVFSFGGGGQSVAALVLGAEGRIPYRTFVFANVGDDAEDPATLEYNERYSKPYAAAHGLELIELHRVRKPESPATLYQHLVRSEHSIGIPVRMSGGKSPAAAGAPAARHCTVDWKIRVVSRWLKGQGVTAEDPAQVGIGFTLDEIERMRGTDPGFDHYRLAYPLLDLRLFRHDCDEIVRKADLPPVPKSACWFCPMKSPAAWQRQRRQNPELFRKAAELETSLNERRARWGKDPVWLTRFLKPLDQAIPESGQLDLFEADGCDSGFCRT